MKWTGNKSSTAGALNTRGFRVVGWTADHVPGCLPQVLEILDFLIATEAVWSETTEMEDEQIKDAYRNNVLVEFIIESSAVMGVKVGIA